MAAEIFTAISALRMVLDSETDADSPDNETTFAAIRKAIESLFLILLGTGFSGTVTGISTTTITHAEAAQTIDVHNGRTTVMTSGACKGNFYTIDDGAAQTLIHTGDDLEADGVLIGDTFVVLYDIKNNTGHTHNAIDASRIDLADDSVDSEHYVADSIDTEHYAPASVDQTALGANCAGQSEIKDGNGTASALVGTGVITSITMQDYCFMPNISGDGGAGNWTLGAYSTPAASYIGRFEITNNGVGSQTYTIYWRYITATDEPFIYSVRDISTGEIKAVWACDDPPPGYWGLDNKPVDFVSPMIFMPAFKNVEEIVLFKYPMDEYKSIIDKAKTDKIQLHNMLTASYDYNDQTKLFVTKNLVHI